MEEKTDGFMPFRKLLAQKWNANSIVQVLTLDTVSISKDDNRLTIYPLVKIIQITPGSKFLMITIFFGLKNRFRICSNTSDQNFLKSNPYKYKKVIEIP